MSDDCLERLPNLQRACLVWHAEGVVPREEKPFAALIKFLQGYELDAQEQSDASKEADCWEASSLGLVRSITFVTDSDQVIRLQQATLDRLPALAAAVKSTIRFKDGLPVVALTDFATLGQFQEHLQRAQTFKASQINFLKQLGCTLELQSSTVGFHVMGTYQELQPATLDLLPKLKADIQEKGQSFLIVKQAELDCLFALERYLATAKRLPVQQYHFLKTLGLATELALSRDRMLSPMSKLLHHSTFEVESTANIWYITKADNVPRNVYLVPRIDSKHFYDALRQLPFLRIQEKGYGDGHWRAQLTWKV